MQRDIRIARYKKAIQTAFKEVADELVAREKFVDQLSAQESLVQEAETALSLSRQRYEMGIDSFLHVLDAQRVLFEGEQALRLTRPQQQINLVQLYRALGGGWHPAGTTIAGSVPGSIVSS